MGIVQKQKKEIERKEMQLKMLKQSIAGRDRAIALWEAQAKGADQFASIFLFVITFRTACKISGAG